MILGVILDLHKINTKGFDEALKEAIYIHRNAIDNDFGYDILGIYNLADYMHTIGYQEYIIDKVAIKDNLIDIGGGYFGASKLSNAIVESYSVDELFYVDKNVMVILDIE